MFKKKILRNIPLLFLLIIYTICHIAFYSNDFYTNFLNPLFWLIFLIIFHHQDLELLNRKESNMTLMVAIILFILYLASGFVFGFSKSPYSHNLSNILLNSIRIILTIYGIEVIRHTLLKSNRCHFGIRVLITLIIILSEINFKALFLSRNIALLHYLISIIIPIIAYNFLYSYLSLNSHYDIPIILRLFNELPKVLLPILPYHNWFIEGAFSTIKVLIIYYLFKYYIYNKHPLKHSSNMIYPLTIITSIILVLFMLGFFKYRPIAILSNSMNPIFKRGDIVIYKDSKDIIPGDIIVFQYENQIIVHRVISINEYYITKGDSNNSIDHIKVKKEDILGIYQFSIKYLGYPSIWLNELFTKEN